MLPKHGITEPLAQTEIRTPNDGVLVISTALVATGRGINGSPFAVVETKVFGSGEFDGKSELIRTLDLQEEGRAEAMSSHNNIVRRIEESLTQQT